MKRKIYVACAVSAVITAAFLTINTGTVYAKNNDDIKANTAPAGVSINGQDISGMVINEVSDMISREIEKYDSTVFTLKAETETLKASGKDLSIEVYNKDVGSFAVGYGKKGNLIERFMDNSDIAAGRKKDFSLVFSANEAKAAAYLEAKAPELASAPVDNSLKRENGEFIFIEGKAGTAVDFQASAKAISDFMINSWTGEQAEIDLMVIKEEPRGTREELGAIRDLLGGFHTDFSSSSQARAGNVKNGASLINGSIIYPGEEYSVSKHLKERNAENGYFLAPSYENGTTVDTYGGGICQISTTLYNAVIRSELEILERHPHSMIVSYVSPSMDAAVSEGSKDLVFKNNLNNPIYIEGYTNGGMLYFNIFGKDERSEGRDITFESEVLGTTEAGEKYIADPALPIGTISKQQSAHTGYSARLWKIVKENGQEISRDIFNKSNYKPGDAIYLVGIAGDPGHGAAIAGAVETQDRGTIDAAIGIGAPAPEPAPAPTPAPAPAAESAPAPETPAP